MIDVIGGAYREMCLRPQRAGYYGSGTTAAIVLRSLDADVTLTTVLSAGDESDFRLALGAYNISLRVLEASQTLDFFYTTPLAIPQIFPRLDVIAQPPLFVRADRALVFGMLDAQPVVQAKQVVYDPQSGWRPQGFRDMGGSADRLAYVLNGEELRLLSREQDQHTAARGLIERDDVEVVVVKRGIEGALVVERDRLADPINIPAYSCGHSAHQIGSGDVFSSIFAHRWFAGLSASEAADQASRVVARYVTDGNPETAIEPAQTQRISPWRGDVYIAAPFFTLAECWMLEEVRGYLRGVGINPRSPLHEVGRGSSRDIAPRDLALLRKCGRVLALLDGRDPGTIFEIGYAIDRNIDVWGVSTSTREARHDEGDLRMLLGAGVRVFDDLTAATIDIATAR